MGIVLVLILSSVSVGEDWPMLGYDIHSTGYTLESAPDVCNLVWYYTTGARVLSSPVVVNGILYIGSEDFHLYALNSFNGSLVWKFYTGVGYDIDSTPTVYNDIVYFGTSRSSSENKIYALDANDGSHIWNHSIDGSIRSGLLYVEGVIYATGYNIGLLSLNASTGEQIWNFTSEGSIYSSPTFYDNTIYVGSGNGKVIAIDAVTGTEKWNYTTSKYVYKTATFAYGNVYVGDTDGILYCLNATFGTEVWTYPTGNWIHSDPAVFDYKVIFGNHGGNLYTLNATNGNLIWDYHSGGTIQTHPAISGNKVYFGSTNSILHCLSLDSGSVIWNYTVNDRIYSSPAIANGYIYTATYGNIIYCFGPAGANLPPYPAVPTSPSSDVWTNDNTPLFEWQHSDPLNDSQGGFHIQIDNNKDFLSIDYEFNNSAEPNSTWQFPDGSGYSAIVDGQWYWRVKTMDNKSAWGNWGICWKIKIDSVKPVSNVLPIIPMDYVSPPVSINCTGSDERSGLNNIDLYYRHSVDNSTGWTSWQSFGTDFDEPWNWEFTLPEGEGYYEFYSSACDNSSNIEDPPPEADARCTLLIPPKVESTEPLNNSIDIRTFVNVKITFNEAMNEPSVEASLSFSYNVPPYSMSWDQNTLIITFDEPLFYNNSFSIKINCEVARDLAGNMLDGNGNNKTDGSPSDDYYFRFSTLEKPIVDGWPTFQHDLLRTGLTNATGRMTAFQRRWTYETRESVFSSPVVADINDDGKVEVVCGDYGSPSYIFALHGDNGTLIWEYKVGNPVEGVPAVGDVNGDGKIDVVAGSNDNWVYALNGNNGSLIWKIPLPDNAINPAIVDIDNDTVPEVIIGCYDDTLYVLNGINGTIEWSRTFTDGVLCAPAILDLDHDGELEMLIIDGGDIVALNGNNTVVWQVPTYGRETPAVGDVDNDGVLEFVYSSGNGVTCRNAETGSYEWSRGVSDDVMSSPAIGDLDGDGYMEVVFGCDNKYIFVWDGRDGSDHWRYEFSGFINPIRGSPGIADIDGDGKLEVVIGTWRGSMYAFNGEDGSILWDEGLGSSYWSSPAITDINGDGWVEIVIGNELGRIYALEAVEEYIPPKILSTSPNNGEINVDINSNITIIFNENMNHSSVEESISITPNHPFSGLLWDATELKITSLFPLSPNTKYTITINSTVARDLAGNYLDGNGNGYSEGNPNDDYIWSFWTGSHSLFLDYGWNLISVPTIQSDNDLNSVLLPINGYYDAVQFYNITNPSDYWKHNHISKPNMLNDHQRIDHLIGFWIHITEPGGILFDYSGTQPSSNQNIQLYKGWNMVGYPSLTNYNRTVGLNNLEFGTDVDAIQWYDAATKTWHFMGPDDSFVPGRGYWMHSKVDTTWEVPI
jgi:outer membrane protein assembly factor BamB